MTKPVVRKLRCAVYTRKSSEEGLEQEFNSLHAQREACEAYIASQRSEGWVLVRDQYDDGGISDEAGDQVTSAVVEASEPPKKERKALTGKNEVAMQALYDALREHGETKSGNAYPSNRKVVHVDRWRDACAVHGLTSGTSDSAGRQAFKRAKDKLMDMNEVRKWGDHVWRVQDDD